MSTQQLIELPKGDFTQEKLTHSLFDWKESVLTEKVLSLSRWIGTITNEAELDEVMKDGLHPFAKYLGDRQQNSPQWKSIIEQFSLVVEKIPNGPATVSTAKPWSYRYYSWARSYSIVIKDATVLKTVFDKKITELLETATDLGDIKSGLNKDSMDYFYNNEFQMVIISVCTKQILVACTKENYPLFQHIESFSKSKHDYISSSSPYNSLLSKLVDGVRKQIIAFVQNSLENKPETLPDLELLVNVCYNGNRFIDSKTQQQVVDLVDVYIDKQIAAGKPWVEIEPLYKSLRIKTKEYYKMEIANSDLQTLKANYQHHCALKPSGAELGLRNLLRQEELFLIEIMGATTSEQLVKIQGQIPVELGHLHNDVMRQAAALIKKP